MKRLSYLVIAGTCSFLLSTTALAFPLSQIGSFQDTGTDDTIGFAGSYAPADWTGSHGRFDDPFWETDLILNQNESSLRVFLLSDNTSGSGEINLYIPGFSYESRSNNAVGNAAFLSGIMFGIPVLGGSSDTQIAGVGLAAWIGGVLAIGPRDSLHLDLSARLGGSAFVGPLFLGSLLISVNAGLRIPLGEKAWLHPEISLGCNVVAPGGFAMCAPALGTAIAF